MVEALRALVVVLFLATLPGSGGAPGLEVPEGRSAVLEEAAPPAGAAPTIVDSVDGLRRALEDPAPQRWIRLQRGEYILDRPLVLPRSTTLEGEGAMRFDGEGLPAGFDPASAATIRAAPGFAGDLLTLDHEVSLRALRIVDPAHGGPVTRAGNAVMLASRAPGAYAAATIRECEVISEHPAGIGADGPIGHAVVTMTRNPGRGQPTELYAGARLDLAIERSLLRASGGGQAIFSIQFAPQGAVGLEIVSNRIEGALIVAAGVSRPDAVEGARTSVHSRDNSFRFVGGFVAFGWQIFAGSSSHLTGIGAAVTTGNSVDLTSVRDRIEGFRTAILAVGGRRINDGAGEVSGNRATLSLADLNLQSAGEGGADLVLLAALSGYSPDERAGFVAGEKNRIEVTLAGVRGSGPRANEYGHDSGFAAASGTRTANWLEIAGSPAAFRESNSGISPPPPVGFFASSDPERR